MVTQGVPRGPRSALSQLFHMKDPFPLMLELEREWGDPVTVPILGGAPIVMCSSPEHIKPVFTGDPMSFASGNNEALAVILGSGSIFLQSGEQHRRTRKLLMPPFHGERMRAYAGIMREAAARWAEKIPRGRSSELLPVAQGITLDVIIEAIFGEQDPARVRALHEGILGVVASFNPLIGTFKFLQREFGGFGPWAKFKRNASALEARMKELIDEKRTSPGEDILSLLVQARDEDGKALTEREITEQLLTFVVAGHETTATSLAWAMYELHRAPHALARLRAELSRAQGQAPESLAKLPYLQAACSETLRMHPPVPMIPRKCLKPLVVGDFELPAGTIVAPSVYNAHHREETFEKPFEFHPERFIDKSYSPFEYLPWGGGHRRCLGASFASFEMAVVLATLLDAGTFTLDEPKPLGNAFRIGTYGPETGVRMTLRA